MNKLILKVSFKRTIKTQAFVVHAHKLYIGVAEAER